MTTQTSTSVDLKDLKAKAKDLAAQRKTVSEALKAGKDLAKTQEAEQAQALMNEINALGSTMVVVGEHTLSLKEALIDGKPSTIKVTDKATGETKERAHTIFLDAGRIASLRKLVARFGKIARDEEIRPKALPKADEAPAA